MLEDSHDHAKLMYRHSKKVTTWVTEDDPPTVRNQSLEKDAPQDPNPSGVSEAEEQRLKELEEQVLRKEKKNSKNVAQEQEKSLSNKE